jgi:hypothetical protein
MTISTLTAKTIVAAILTSFALWFYPNRVLLGLLALSVWVLVIAGAISRDPIFMLEAGVLLYLGAAVAWIYLGIHRAFRKPERFCADGCSPKGSPEKRASTGAAGRGPGVTL